MKTIFYISLLLGFITIASCKKDKDGEKELSQNTWTFKLADGYENIGLKDLVTKYESESVKLNIQGYGQLYALSKTRYVGDGAGDKSSITVYFKGMPLVNKEYKITSLERIATHDDEVAIGVMMGGHSGIPESGGGGVTFMSDGDGSQLLSYKFSDSKGSAEFKNVKVWIGNAMSRKSAIVSARISQ